MAIHFYALLSRMKYILRWGLMRQSRPENLSEHTAETAVLAHALAVIGNRRLGRRYDEGQAVLYALYHDCSEIITGDLPTPIKYENDSIRTAYKAVEQKAARRLGRLLPPDLRAAYQPYLEGPQGELARLVKAADKLSALIKCMEEEAAGNREFLRAKEASLASLAALGLPEAEIFLQECLPSYGLSLDELKEAPPAGEGAPIRYHSTGLSRKEETG